MFFHLIGPLYQFGVYVLDDFVCGFYSDVYFLRSISLNFKIVLIVSDSIGLRCGAHWNYFVFFLAVIDVEEFYRNFFWGGAIK
jgi:hypothetical protein